MDVKMPDKMQMIHIASEAVVALGMMFYFSSKNRKLQGYIEEISQRLEDQETTIQTLQQNVSTLETSIQQLTSKLEAVNKEISARLAAIYGYMNKIDDKLNAISVEPVTNKKQKKKSPTPEPVKKEVTPVARSNNDEVLETLLNNPVFSKPKVVVMTSNMPINTPLKQKMNIIEEGEEESTDEEDEEELEKEIKTELAELED
jgi:septal ring factor EnvC (AmiA/AmiB activator)